MIQHRSTFFIALFILLTEVFFGFPSSWKVVLIVLCALVLMALSVKITLPKKLPKKPRRKEKVTSVFVENVPMQPRESTTSQNSTDDIIM